MAEKIEAKTSHRCKASAQRVYEAWLKPDKVRAWMKASLQSMGLAGDVRQIEIAPRVGGAFLFTDMRDGAEARHWGTYAELEDSRKIAFTWIVDESEESDPSRVVLQLRPDGEGCIATLTHELDAKWADYIAQTENAWKCMLQATDAMLEEEGG